jgi:hydroxyquinol 1,2-dioxygenase
MRNLTEANATDAVLQQFGGASDPRLKQVISSLVRHLHAFARDVQLTEAEWLQGIQFLTRTGQMCDSVRQEFILLSDTLGLSILVDAINHRRPPTATENSLLGPFFRENAPELPLHSNIARTPGEPLWMHGRVLTMQEEPIAGACLEIWQSATNGQYEGQDPHQPAGNLRAIFKSSTDGGYAFRTIKPTSYPIPTDGPVGQLLQALGRHPYRPAHVHFKISAPGYETLVTELFTAGDPYLDSDAVFGVKSSLVLELQRNDSPQAAAQHGFEGPFHEARYDFRLQRV